MSDVGTASTLLALLPVVVGGLIGIIAASVGPYLMQRAKDAADKKRKRAEKFEELVGAVYEYDHWIDTTRGIRVVGFEGAITVSPFAKIHAISDIYFPQFERAVEELRTAGHAYVMWMLEAAQNRPQKDTLDASLAEHETVVRPYMEKRNALLTELRSFARRVAQHCTCDHRSVRSPCRCFHHDGG